MPGKKGPRGIPHLSFNRDPKTKGIKATVTDASVLETVSMKVSVSLGGPQ